MKDFNQKQLDQAHDDDSSPIEMSDLGLPHYDSGNSMMLSSHRFLVWQRSLSRKRMRFATALGILLLLLLVLLLSLQTIMPFFVALRNGVTSNSVKQSLPINIKAALVIFPQHDGFACLADTSWSLDSKFVAIVGYQKSCSLENNMYDLGQVDIYDALTGKVMGRFQPDSAILSALHTQFPKIQGRPVIYYNHILWSPVGKGLALTFSIYLLFQPLSSQITGLNGVLLRDLDGRDGKILLQIQPTNPLYTEWDLELGRAVDTSTAKGSSAEVFNWAANGELIGNKVDKRQQDRATSAAAPHDVIGNPDGGVAFTIWQPGWVTLTTQTGQGPVHLPGVYTWTTFFVAWSPDGRYLIDNVYVDGRLSILGQATPSPQTLTDLQMDQLPSFPVRDKGLQHVLSTLVGAPDFLTKEAISWHPGGRSLAEYDAGTGDLDLFDTTTGFQTASLLLPASATFLGTTTVLHWSPNGLRLFLFDPQIGSLVIWDVK
ncbi:MAG: hypothetical protein NVSMB27_24030 [Ktedonobacteraceae bacterium]